MIFARIWEKEGFKPQNSKNFLDVVSVELTKISADIKYWIMNEKIKHTKNVVEKYLLKIERKVKS